MSTHNGIILSFFSLRLLKYFQKKLLILKKKIFFFQLRPLKYPFFFNKMLTFKDYSEMRYLKNVYISRCIYNMQHIKNRTQKKKLKKKKS